MDKTVLPSGQHGGLDIDVSGMITTGAYVAATPKLVWHTTQGKSFDTDVQTLITKRVQPHVVIDPHSGRVRQLVPLDQFAKALEHPPRTPETNRAHCIQVEISGYAEAAGTWPEACYERLGALAVLLEQRQGIARISTVPFDSTPNSTPHRLTPASFISAKGHLGHEHVPSQPHGHWDPGRLDIALLFRCMNQAERQHQ
jgi:hypothetical protein